MPSLAQKFFIDSAGNYLGSWTGFKHPDDLFLDREGALIMIDGEPVIASEGATIDPSPPSGAIEVPFPPADGRDVWDGTKYIPHIEPPSQIELASLVGILVRKGMVSQAEIAAEIGPKG